MSTETLSSNDDFYEQAKKILLEQLQEQETVSTRELKSLLAKKGITESDAIISRLKYIQSDKEKPEWMHHGRSFYTIAAYNEQLAIEEKSAEAIPADETNDDVEECDDQILEDTCSSPEIPKKKRRQDENRMCNYVKTALSEIYDPESRPNDENIFLVNKKTASGSFRNVDLLAVDWRTESHYELVTVEAKLHFNAQAILQASNYTRFSHRVWIAIRVPSGTRPETAAQFLKETDRLLYEHVLDLGIGILACIPSVGNSYRIAPIQWPKLQKPTEIELYHCQEAYRGYLEEAGVLEKKRIFAKPAA